MRWILAVSSFFCLLACKGGSETEPAAPNPYSFNLQMTRVSQAGVDPFDVTVTLLNSGVALPGQTLTLNVPKGSVSAVSDNSDGT